MEKSAIYKLRSYSEEEKQEVLYYSLVWGGVSLSGFCGVVQPAAQSSDSAAEHVVVTYLCITVLVIRQLHALFKLMVSSAALLECTLTST